MNERTCKYCNALFYKRENEYPKRYSIRQICSKRCGLIHRNKSIEQINKIKKKLTGRKKITTEKMKWSEERKVEWSKRLSGENSHFWRGGKTSKNLIIRQSSIYSAWRKSVFERDDFTCKFCNKRGGKLNADHIKPFALFPELRFELSNGRTLCVECHRKTDTWGGVRTKSL